MYDLDYNDLMTIDSDGVQRARSRFAPHRTMLSTSCRTSLSLQLQWPRHPWSAVDVNEEARGHSSLQVNVQVAALVLRLGNGGINAMKMATLLGIPLSIN